MCQQQAGKGSIFVSGTDGDKGVAIVQQLLQLPAQHKHLCAQHVYAGLPDDTTPRAKSLQGLGAQVVAFDIFNDHQAAVKALTGITKLCLLIDPLSERMQRSNAYLYGKAFIDAAKEAHVEHVIFLTPFTPLDPVSPPASPSSEQPPSASSTPVIYGSYRSQFMLIESYLHSQFDNNGITILRYPGVLHQHLLVFSKYIAQHNAFPLPDQHLEITVESCNMFDIARATACVAHSPTLRHSRNAYKISSGLLTLEEVGQRVLSGLQRENTINRMDSATLQQIICDSIGNEDQATFLMEMWGLQQKLSGRRLEITRDLEALTGQSGKSLNEYFEEDEVRDAFLSSHNNGEMSLSKPLNSVYSTCKAPRTLPTLVKFSGYSVGAAVGAAIADRSCQLFLFVGDGSFQLTFQEVSVFLHHGWTPVIFLLDNDDYLVEKLIHGPERDYNNYHMWQYSKTLGFFGAHLERNTSTGCSKVGFESKVSARQEFEAAMNSITAQPDKMHFVEVVMPRFDAPRELELLVATSENR